MKPPLLWYGGKIKACGRLLRVLPPHVTFVEVFGGSGALLFAKKPSKVEIFNDLDAELTNFYSVVRNRGRELREKLELTLYARDEYEAAAEGYEGVSDPVERARRFFVLVNQSINSYFYGGWGRQKSTSRTSGFNACIDRLTDATKRIRRVTIENRDFRKIISEFDGPDTLFYIDPPYVSGTRTAPKRYRHEMTDADHSDLLALLKGLKGSAVVSGHPHPMYDAALSDWRRIEIDMPNHAAVVRGSDLGEPKARRKEVVWVSPNVSQDAVARGLDRSAHRADLHAGDCFDVLPTLGAREWVVITDPPFNAGRPFENDRLSDTQYRAFCNRFALEMHRLQPVNLIVEVAKGDILMRGAVEQYFRFRDVICLNYTNSMRQGGEVGYSNWGMALWFSNTGKCYNPYKDRLDAAVSSSKGDFFHPTPKQVEHYERLCRMFSTESMTVLDPFMGSGTTGVSAGNANREFVGVEISDEYFDTAAARIAEVAPVQIHRQPAVPRDDDALPSRGPVTNDRLKSDRA